MRRTRNSEKAITSNVAHNVKPYNVGAVSQEILILLLLAHNNHAENAVMFGEAMKLKQISENSLADSLGRKLHGSNYFNRPTFQTQALYNPSTGSDSGSRSAGFSQSVTGVPTNPRHRQFLGFEKRLGAIRL